LHTNKYLTSNDHLWILKLCNTFGLFRRLGKVQPPFLESLILVQVDAEVNEREKKLGLKQF
jgi:hypothetical protein